MTCPECERQIAPNALACPYCGYPLRERVTPPIAGGGAGSGAKVGLIVAGVVGVGLFGAVFMGILAAIAIPRFTRASTQASDVAAQQMLIRALDAERAYNEQHQRYTRSVSELAQYRGPEWLKAQGYRLEIPKAGENFVCLEAIPVVEGRGTPLSMDVYGSVYRGADCTTGAPYVRSGAGSANQ